MKKIFYILSGILIAANLYWVFATPLLPFIDLPFHLAESFVVKNFGNHDFLFSRYYAIPTFIKSNTFHTFFCSAGIFHDVETANKIYYALYVVLLPLSVLLLIRTLGGNVYFSLLSFLFIVNYSVHWGFTGYTMSVPVIFILFNLYHVYFVKGNLKAGFLFMPVFIILFSLHFQSAIYAILVLFILQFFYRKKSVKHWTVSVLAVVPVLSLMVYAYSTDAQGGTSLPEFLFNYYMLDYTGSFINRLGVFFILDNFFLFKGEAGIAIACLASVPITAAIVYLFSKKKIRFEGNAKYLIIILAVTLACYMLLPDNINGQNIIFERYSVIALLMMIVTAGVALKNEFTDAAKNGLKKAFPFIIALPVLAQSVILLDYMNDFRKESSDFNRTFYKDVGNVIMAGIIKENDFRGRKIWTHFPMYYTVWNGGVTTGLIDYKFGLLKRNVPKEILPQYREWLDDRKFDYGRYYMAAEFITARSDKEDAINSFSVKAVSGKWKLYRNVHSFSP